MLGHVMTTRRGWVSAWAIALALAACQSPRPATQALVIVDADPLVRAETSRVTYTVRGGSADSVQLPVREMRELSPVAWPFDLTVAPLLGDVSRVFEVEASALDLADRVVARVRVRSGFTPGQTRTITLHMDDRCRGILCDDDQTCVGGRCVASTPMDRDGGVGGLDGGMPMPCVTDAECDDGIFCNGRETCSGVCLPGDRPDCSDGIECTSDRCEVDGCVHVPDARMCTAGPGGRCEERGGCQYDVCDEVTCVAGPCERARCEGTRCVRESSCAAGQSCCGSSCQPIGCDDGNPCTADACNASASACTHSPRDFACSDGDACTVGDRCSMGRCVSTGMLVCDDANPCTNDSCAPTLGCQYIDGAGACSDGDPCTVDDRCGGGACIPGAPMPCSDGIACTTDSCTGGTCTSVPRDSLCPGLARCIAGVGCQFATSCDPASCAASAGPCETGTCSGTTCVISGGCAAGQTCCGGTCRNCNDGNPCTSDGCSGGACANTPISGACDDGNACTTGDACSGGTCQGAPRACDDGNPCTTDTCNPATGACGSTPRTGACDDGNLCTMSETCSAGVCGGGFPTFCDDGNPCTLDSCTAGVGCTYTTRSPGASCGDEGDCLRYRCVGTMCTAEPGCSPTEVCCIGGCQPRGTFCE